MDPWLFLLALVATVLGLFAIIDAGYARSIAASQGAIPREFKIQLAATLVAMAIGVVVASVHIVRWQRAWVWVGFGTLLLVCTTQIPGLGVTLSGARRWIDLGPIQIQPSEFAKVGVIVFLAGLFAGRKEWVQQKWKSWDQFLDRIAVPKLARAIPLLLALLIAIKVELEPDLGTAAVIMFIIVSMMILGGVSWKSLAAFIFVGLVGVGLLVAKEPYRMERITSHAHRWEKKNFDDIGYQTTQSEMAMASSGTKVLGIGTGRAKHMLPAATTDFIMATIAEEFGLFGALSVLLIMGLLVWRLYALSLLAHNRFAQLVLQGVAAWLAIQTCVNMMMANGALPPIGIPLPFFSSGGSSLIALWVAIGICQSASAEYSKEELAYEGRRHRGRDGRSRFSRA